MVDFTQDIGHVHVGKNAIGEPFECADNCPHPIHDECPVDGCGDPRPHHHREDADWGEYKVYADGE